MNHLYTQARKNARSRGIRFALTPAEFGAICLRSAGCCEVTGIPFDDARDASGRKHDRHPWRPSLDRIDSAEGYVASNCRLVCVAVNAALNTWGEGVLRRIAINLLGFADHQATLPANVVAREAKGGYRYEARGYVGKGKRVHLGCFNSIDEAAEAVNRFRETRDL